MSSKFVFQSSKSTLSEVQTGRGSLSSSSMRWVRETQRSVSSTPNNTLFSPLARLSTNNWQTTNYSAWFGWRINFIFILYIYHYIGYTLHSDSALWITQTSSKGLVVVNILSPNCVRRLEKREMIMMIKNVMMYLDCMLILSKVFDLNHIFLLVAILLKIQRERLQLLRYKNSKLQITWEL